MKFVFQKFKNDTWQQEFINICKSRGHNVLEVNYSSNLYLSKELIEFCDSPQFFGKGPIDWTPYCFFFFGSVGFIKICDETYHGGACYKTEFCAENFLCTNYFPEVIEYLFNDNHAFFLASSIPALKWNIFNNFSKDAIIFMRPNSGEKEFNAGLFDLQYFGKDWDNIQDRLKPNDLVLISTPKNIRGEWRFIVNDKQEIITGSTYKYGDKLTIIPTWPKGAEQMCKKVLTKLRPPAKIFAVDICEDNDGNFWLLEINSFFSAGLYASDKGKILDYLETM